MADDDVDSLAAKDTFALEQEDWPTSAASVRSVFADPTPKESPPASLGSGVGLREEQHATEVTGAAGSSAQGHAPAESSAQTDGMLDSRVSSATANGSNHGAATSNDVDPFAETDAALHSSSDPQVDHRSPAASSSSLLVRSVAAVMLTP